MAFVFHQGIRAESLSEPPFEVDWIRTSRCRTLNALVFPPKLIDMPTLLAR